MNNKIKKNIKIIIIIVLIVILYMCNLYVMKKSTAYQTLYDFLPENVIIVGDTVFEGYVNPNLLANASIEYYKKTSNKELEVYKYSGLDMNSNPIWGKYSDENNSYILVNEEELNRIEEILKIKYGIASN